MLGKKPPRRVLLAMTLLLAAPVFAQEAGKSKPAQKEAYSGSDLYRTYCTSCHGLSAKGDGPLAERLRFRPPDLTLIARRNERKWDADKVARMIDGREPVKGHGGPDMPVWGDAFRSSREGFDEEAVKAKVTVLVEYLQSLQEPGDKPQD
jgi:mono/diheme cytochrome c family protein